jgi:hypothetical protein
VFAFVKASRLVPKSSFLYTSVRELTTGKRRLYGFWDAQLTDGDSNAKDLPGVAQALEKELAQTWATPEIAAEIAKRLSDYIRSYMQDFVRAVSAANFETSEVGSVLRAVYFAQRIAVDLSWLEQRYGMGFLHRMLPKQSTEALAKQLTPSAVALRWIRKLEKVSAAKAAILAGREPVDVVGQMDRWENARSSPRQDSLPLIRELYGLNSNFCYRLWFWISLVLDEAGPAFCAEIAACLGHGFDIETAKRPFVEMSNRRITSLDVPECFHVLDRLLCRQTTRKPEDRERAFAALEELKQFTEAHDGIVEYHIYAMQARIAVFSRHPREALELYVQAISLARYAEPKSAERISRELAALCAREKYAVPLKDINDTQWLFRLHPIQTRRMPYDDHETPVSAAGTKRAFDYYRYFPPQLFFDRAPDS